MRIGIIGSGFGLYGLLPAFNSIDNCEVVAICGKKTERLTNYCKSIGLNKIYDKWEQMLESEKLDALAIAVTPSAQYKIAKAAMEKGIHIFAEKPLTANLSEAKKLLTIAKKNEITTAVDFIFPEIDEWQKVKELLDKKTYGELKHISVNWNFLSYDIKNRISSWKTDVKQGGGALSFYMSHVLYYLEYYGGKIIKTKSLFSYSKASMNGAEVGVDLLLKFKSGASGEVSFYCNAPGMYNHKLTFICEQATIVLENNKDVTESFKITVCTKEDKQEINVKDIKISKNNEDERVIIVKRLASRFISSCCLKKQMTPSFLDGIRVQELIEIVRGNKI